jgi:hypothetical protein
MITLPKFLGALRALFGVDRDELVAAGVLAAGDGEAWRAFRCDPPRWLMAADDERQRRLWTILEGRG